METILLLPQTRVEADMVLRDPSTAGQHGLLEAGAMSVSGEKQRQEYLLVTCCRSVSIRRQDPSA